MVNKAIFTPNGKRICSIGEDATLKTWSITQQQPMSDIAKKKTMDFHEQEILDIAIHNNNNLAVTVSVDDCYCLSNIENEEVYKKCGGIEKI